jgi:hypothetical protein
MMPVESAIRQGPAAASVVVKSARRRRLRDSSQGPISKAIGNVRLMMNNMDGLAVYRPALLSTGGFPGGFPGGCPGGLPGTL